jgi:hypothetical protein
LIQIKDAGRRCVPSRNVSKRETWQHHFSCRDREQGPEVPLSASGSQSMTIVSSRSLLAPISLCIAGYTSQMLGR